MHKILLKGRGIEHAYSEGAIRTPVLKGVDLDIEASKMTAIVGKSGSGKSTLLHILGTLDSPDKGEIVFYDTDIISLSARDKAVFRNRHLGFVYQFHHLLGDFTARENIMMPLLIDGIARQLAASRADYLLERVGLADKGGKLPAEMSGGERQRVAIARALAYSPELILADEPTGNLDETNAAMVFDLFRELVRDESAAVVMVTHDTSLAARCDNVFEMTSGIIERGTFRAEESIMLDSHKLDLHTSYKDMVMQRLHNISTSPAAAGASASGMADSTESAGTGTAAVAGATADAQSADSASAAEPARHDSESPQSSQAAAFSTTVGSYRIPQEESNATGSRLREQADARRESREEAGSGAAAAGSDAAASGCGADSAADRADKGAGAAQQECKAVIFDRNND